MTEPRRVARSIKNAITGPEMDRICDRSTAPALVLEDANNISRRWQHNLFDRRPAPALMEDGVLMQATDLDLSTFLAALAQRRAVIKIPTYRSRREAKAKPKEVVRLMAERYGQITGLVSNKQVFSFSVRLLDLSIIEDGKPGSFRAFMLQDVDGEWHEGFSRFAFAPNREENKFIEDFQLANHGEIVFTGFVHANRWQSFYSANYLLAKAMVHRLAELAKYYRAEAKAIVAEAKLTLPEAPEYEFEPDDQGSGRLEKITVHSMEATVDYTYMDEPLQLPALPRTQAGYDLARKYVKEASSVLEALRYATRATEYAFWALGDDREAQLPSWLSGVAWEDEKTARTMWRRLRLHQRAVGERSVGLRYRLTTPITTVRVF